MRELSDLCGALIDLANERGGPDNITVVAARFEGDGLPEPGESEGVGYVVYHLAEGDEEELTTTVPNVTAVAAAPPPILPGNRTRAVLLMAAVCACGGAPPGLALTAPTEARLGVRLGWVAHSRSPPVSPTGSSTRPFPCGSPPRG